MVGLRLETMFMRAGLLVILLLAGCATRTPRLVPGSSALPPGKTLVSMRLVRSLPLVPVTIDDRGPYWFVLDTGAEATVVDERLVAELDLDHRREALDILGADGETTSSGGLARLGTVGFGDATFYDWDACTVDLTHLRLALGVAIDGILGFGTFKGCRFVIDYPGRQVALSRGARLDPDGEDVIPYGAGRLPRVSVVVGEDVVGLVIDSGSAETLALPAARRETYRFAHGPVEGHRATTIGGQARRNVIGRLEGDVSFAGHTVQTPLVFLTEGPGRIGGALLRNFRVTFDMPSRLVRLSRREKAPLITSGFRSPGISIGRSDDGWVIADVVPRTAAQAAGLQIGDRIVFVNGVSASDLTERRWRRLCAQEGSLVLVLLRGSVKIELVLRVTDVVP